MAADPEAQPINTSVAGSAASNDCGKPAATKALLAANRKAVVGQIFMWITALLWGSNPVALRYLYLSDGPPSAAVLAAAQTVLAALILLTVSQAVKAYAGRFGRQTSAAEDAGLVKHDQSISSSPTWQAARPSSADLDGFHTVALLDSPTTSRARSSAQQAANPLHAGPQSAHQPYLQAASSEAETMTGPVVLDPEQAQLRRPASSFSIDDSSPAPPHAVSHLGRARNALAQALNWSTADVRIAGGELGLLAFTANSLTILGFGFSSASRGAFLLRSSIVGTPILSALAGHSVPRSMWVAALIGFAGSVLISLDPTQAAQDGAASEAARAPAANTALLGDTIICCAAAVWSVVMVRQSKHAPHFRAVDLASAKLSVMAVLSSLWLCIDILSAVADDKPASSVWPGYAHLVVWLVLLWPAVGPWTTGEITQIEAQARISASHGQIILAIDPLISVAFAGLVSSSEQHLGLLGWLGGSVLIVACVIASTGAAQAVH